MIQNVQALALHRRLPRCPAVASDAHRHRRLLLPSQETAPYVQDIRQ